MSSASARLRREGYRMCAIAPFFEPIVSVVCARVMLSARECTGRRFILKAGEMWRPANAALRRTSFQRGRVRAPRTQKEKPSAADSSRKSAMVRPSFARSEAACSQARRWGGQRCAVDGSLGMLSEFATACLGGGGGRSPTAQITVRRVRVGLAETKESSRHQQQLAVAMLLVLLFGLSI